MVSLTLSPRNAKALLDVALAVQTKTIRAYPARNASAKATHAYLRDVALTGTMVKALQQRAAR